MYGARRGIKFTRIQEYTKETEHYINDVIIPDETKLRHEQYGDIVVTINYKIYKNIPKKIKALHTFVDRYLPSSIQYVAKLDDDVFVRIDELQNYIHNTFERRTVQQNST